MTKKKKLLYFGSSTGIGLTYHLTIASKYFAKMEEVDYTVVCGDREQFDGLFNILDNYGINYKTFGGIDEVRNFTRSIIPFLKYVGKEKYDVIHVQTNTQLLYGIIAKLTSKVKLIYTIHSYRASKPFRSFIMCSILSVVLNIFVDKVVTLSTLVQKHFKRFLLHSEFLTLGFESKAIKDAFKTNTIDIIYTAKFHTAKGHVWLLDALLPIMKKHVDINAYLLGDGVTLRRCKEMVEKAGLTERIRFPGWVGRNEIDHFMSLANLGIIASKSENGGHCIVEPLFYSLPVISTPVGIAPDVVKNGYNGFLVDYKDINALQTAVLFFYKDRQKMREFGKKSHEIAINNLSWDVISKKYEALLSTI
jgi:glycosyltransferase involved in cell wall biosynthesis